MSRQQPRNRPEIIWVKGLAKMIERGENPLDSAEVRKALAAAKARSAARRKRLAHK